jgi:hypothetical protein
MAWQPGQSGNPGGRPKESPIAKELAKAHTEKAVRVLAELLDAEDLRARAAAAQALLDRGWGKPSQETNVNLSGNLHTLLSGLPIVTPRQNPPLEE